MGKIIFSLYIRQHIIFILGTHKNTKFKKYKSPPLLLKQVINLLNKNIENQLN